MITREDVIVGAKTIYGEARGEDYEGMRAVAHVLINRTKLNGKDHCVAAACLRWMQFSCWNPSDPNRIQIDNVSVNDRSYRLAMRAFLEAVDEIDFTKGATFYHTTQILPTWAQGKLPCYAHGNHLFYNNI